MAENFSILGKKTNIQIQEAENLQQDEPNELHNKYSGDETNRVKVTVIAIIIKGCTRLKKKKVKCDIKNIKHRKGD